MTVSMLNPDNGKSAEVHPDEVENWKRHGWREQASDDVPVDELTSLRVEAERLGIDVDRRWGEKRLKDEIDKAAK